MYAEIRGDRVLPVEVKVAPAPAEAAPAPSEGPMPRGRVGVGTWATRSEYKDMKVMVGDQVVYSTDPEKAPQEWRTGAGQWSWDGGTLRQSGDETNCRATVGDADWTDYTYTLKARKISGAEGFLIMYHVRNNDNWLWWNIGGWGNTRSAVQKGEGGGDRELGRPQNVTIQPNRWYDIKVEVQGRQIKCYLDGELAAERTDTAAPPQAPPAPFYANALRDTASGDVILRVVHTEAVARPLKIALEGIGSIAKQAQVEVLSGQPMDVNTVENPTKIAPQRSTIEKAGTTFVHEFPAHSLSVFRLKAR